MNKIVLILFLFALFIGCSESKEEDFVARVGNHFLTESMIEKALNENGGDKIFREEFIRTWIEKEVIYLSAINKGVTKSKKYSELIGNVKIEIANSMVIGEVIKAKNDSISEEELENYYVENISEFKLTSEQVQYNQASFNSKKYAKEFRHKLVSMSWEKALDEFYTNNSILFSRVDELEYIHNLFPFSIREKLLKLRINTNSAVFESSNGIFTVVRLNKHYKKNEVPEFFEIKQKIEKKYQVLQRKEFYNNYIKELYSKYSSEIER
jgi:hypothetical protein